MREHGAMRKRQRQAQADIKAPVRYTVTYFPVLCGEDSMTTILPIS